MAYIIRLPFVVTSRFGHRSFFFVFYYARRLTVLLHLISAMTQGSYYLVPFSGLLSVFPATVRVSNKRIYPSSLSRCASLQASREMHPQK
jgi:hypothetical protein